jgi:hypothetical protein
MHDGWASFKYLNNSPEDMGNGFPIIDGDYTILGHYSRDHAIAIQYIHGGGGIASFGHLSGED